MMQRPSTQQAYGQYPSTPSHNSSSGYPSHPGVTDFMTPGFSQRVEPSQAHNTHYYTTDIYRDQSAVRTGPGCGNDAYGGSISGYGSNHAMAGSCGTPAPQPLQNSDCSMPIIPYSNLRQGGPYYARYRLGTDQVPGPTMGFSPHLPETDHPTCTNDAYGGSSISGYGSNHDMAGSRLGILTPQPLQNGDCSMPSIPYSNLRQGEPYDAGSGFRFSTGQVPCPTMNVSPRLPEAGPNQDAPSEWHFHTCWVSHAEEDEIHMTIALKKSSLVVC